MGSSIERNEGATIALQAFDWFGCAVQTIGDLDGDGIVELVVGARGDDQGAPNAGAVYVLFLDPHANIRSHRTVTNPIEAGLFGSALCLRQGDESARGSLTESSSLFVGAPGEDRYQGAIYLLLLRADGSVQATTKIAPSTWGASGPALAAHARFGSSIAARNLNSAHSFQLSVGAPGAEAGVGAVVIFDMRKSAVRTYSLLAPPDASVTSAFGSFVMYGADFDGDGIRDMIAGGAASLYALSSGDDRTSTRTRTSTTSSSARPTRWVLVQEAVGKSPAPNELAHVVGARPVALLGNQTMASDAPLLWLSRERPRTARAAQLKPSSAHLRQHLEGDADDRSATWRNRPLAILGLVTAVLLLICAAVSRCLKGRKLRAQHVATCDACSPYVLSS